MNVKNSSYFVIIILLIVKFFFVEFFRFKYGMVNFISF